MLIKLAAHPANKNNSMVDMETFETKQWLEYSRVQRERYIVGGRVIMGEQTKQTMKLSPQCYKYDNSCFQFHHHQKVQT